MQEESEVVLRRLDLKDDVESNDKGEGEEEEGDEGVAEIRTDIVSTQGMTMGTVAKETVVAEEEAAMEEIIIKAVTGTDAMVARVAEDLGVA